MPMSTEFDIVSWVENYDKETQSIIGEMIEEGYGDYDIGSKWLQRDIDKQILIAIFNLERTE